MLNVRATVKKNSCGEYVVRLWINNSHNPESNYYTDDKKDAHDTAKAMIERTKEYATNAGLMV